MIESIYIILLYSATLFFPALLDSTLFLSILLYIDF